MINKYWKKFAIFTDFESKCQAPGPDSTFSKIWIRIQATHPDPSKTSGSATLIVGYDQRPAGADQRECRQGVQQGVQHHRIQQQPRKR